MTLIDIVQRLRFDAIRCEATFSRGVASNITEAAEVIDRMRAALEELRVLGEQGSPPDHSRWIAFHDRVSEIANRGLSADKRS